MIKVIKELTFEELHHHLLEIAKAFDAVCRKNNIPYYMLGGTMLGAIRHKGFIPWDDDMDLGCRENILILLLKYLNGICLLNINAVQFIIQGT